MMSKNIGEFNVGDSISALNIDRVSRKSLKRYAKASGDHNPIHINEDFAQESGLPNVIAHGMLIMSYLGKILTSTFPQSTLVNFSSQFISMTHINDRLSCSGEIIKKTTDTTNNTSYDILLKVINESGEKKISGKATIILRSSV